MGERIPISFPFKTRERNALEVEGKSLPRNIAVMNTLHPQELYSIK